jgi:carbon monoxide dehydrogenase subunit G
MESIMWTTEHTAETDLSRAAVWAALRELHEGRRNAPGADVFELEGPFAVGSVVRVTPAGQDTFASTIIELEDGRRYADRTAFGDVELTFSHDLVDAGAGTRVTHRLVIDGPGADAIAPELGPQISEDFPEAMQALFTAAREVA